MKRSVVLKMKNKILVKVYVPTIQEEYNIYIPINIRIGQLTILLSKSISELQDISFDPINTHIIIDTSSGKTYQSDVIIRDTEIVNGSRIILI